MKLNTTQRGTRTKIKRKKKKRILKIKTQKKKEKGGVGDVCHKVLYGHLSIH